MRFSPTAWAKLLFLRDFGQTEVGGFGIAATFDPLLVTDVELVGQTCTMASVVFNDAAVADFFDRQVDLGLRPAQFGRIWVHTHPGNSARPSEVDEETFARAFGSADWAVMFILACGGKTYARLQFAAGPGGGFRIGVRVDYSQAFAASDQAGWTDEYRAHVSAADDVWPAPEIGINAEVPWELNCPPLFGEVRDLILSERHEFNGEEHGYGY